MSLAMNNGFVADKCMLIRFNLVLIMGSLVASSFVSTSPEMGNGGAFLAAMVGMALAPPPDQYSKIRVE